MEKGEGPYGLSISLLERVAAACGGVLQIKFKKAHPASARKQGAAAG